MPRRNENARSVAIVIDLRGRFFRRASLNNQRRQRELRDRARRFGLLQHRSWIA